MNPATPGPLTVLLVPPIGDVALLAGECGGTVPVWTDYGKTAKHLYRDASDAWDWRPINMPSGGMMRALVLVHEGAPVAMGCDRAVRWVNAGERARLRVQLDYDDPAYIQVILHEAVKLGACVVLLRDGREVES